MAFEDRIVENPGRVVLTPVSGEENTYDADYTSAEGEVTQEGTLLNADSMNEAVQDLIDSALTGVDISPNGTFKVRNIQSGRVTIKPVADTPVAKNVTFPSSFENVPNVTATANTTVPQRCSVGIANVTITGFTIYLTRTNTTETSVHWIAVGM